MTIRGPFIRVALALAVAAMVPPTVEAQMAQHTTVVLPPTPAAATLGAPAVTLTADELAIVSAAAAGQGPGDRAAHALLQAKGMTPDQATQTLMDLQALSMGGSPRGSWIEPVQHGG